ncbi:MAG: 2-oxoacid:acceptor oxidoreductase subunit alpha [Chlorobi bacterium]|nr:2-oxoacid:acceptor oxidoreductase subunit alpha [Chlorobiota bacterium]
MGEERPSVTVRFAGDSGDGMQLAGINFSFESALEGHDIATFPDYPAEIRAPRGTLYGVSGFQVRFGKEEILTSGDEVDVLVAMNPAALKRTLHLLKEGGILIADSDAFDAKNLRLAGYEFNPLEDEILKQKYRVLSLPITSLVREALKDSPLSVKAKDRTRNMFVLGLVFWIFGRDLNIAKELIKKKFANKPDVLDANLKVLEAGYYLGETMDIEVPKIKVAKASLPRGRYRTITGNQATALGLVTASKLSGLPLYFVSYPITPASDILHDMAKYRYMDIVAIQAEDEIAAISSAIGAAFGGSIAVTATSGPGLSLMSEALGLAVMTELPVIVIDVQRAGPSTGMPTKPEQADLLQAMFGRHGEAPLIVLASATPADNFYMAIEAVRLATTHITPVILLSDLYLANGAEPWIIPNVETLPKWEPHLWKGNGEYKPYMRDEETLARWWAIPGMEGAQHVVGGLEKEDVTGNVSYDPLNHEKMVKLRLEKVKRVAEDIPLQEVNTGKEEGDLAIVGWGSTYGVIRSVVKQLVEEGYSVGHVHIKYLNPFPKNLKDVLTRFKKILVVEMNMGQLAFLLRGTFLLDVHQFNKVQGVPITERELKQTALKLLK